MPDHLESLLIGGGGECRGLSQVGRGRIEACDIVANVRAQLGRQMAFVSVDPVTGGAEALAVENCPASFCIPRLMAGGVCDVDSAQRSEPASNEIARQSIPARIVPGWSLRTPVLKKNDSMSLSRVMYVSGLLLPS